MLNDFPFSYKLILLVSDRQIYSQPPRKPRPRMNSAIFVSNSGPGLDPKEFFRRHGSVSKLCRKARSVDNISLEEKHFGLPQLSISGPSPPEDEDKFLEREAEETETLMQDEWTFPVYPKRWFLTYVRFGGKLHLVFHIFDYVTPLIILRFKKFDVL